jgi:hypothetical protein
MGSFAPSVDLKPPVLLPQSVLKPHLVSASVMLYSKGVPRVPLALWVPVPAVQQAKLALKRTYVPLKVPAEASAPLLH